MSEIEQYNTNLLAEDKLIAEKLLSILDCEYSDVTSKIWHAHPVWFINDNPIVGYSKQKKGIRLMFWSGADFEEEKLSVIGGKFKDASIFYNSISEIEENDIQRWLEKARVIQWDYKNIVKRKGKLERLHLHESH